MKVECQIEYWTKLALDSSAPPQPFTIDNVEFIFDQHLKSHDNNGSVTTCIQSLEFSRYLEKYLWPNYAKHSKNLKLNLSIILILNEKYKERIDPWVYFNEKANSSLDKKCLEKFLNNILFLSLQFSESDSYFKLENCDNMNNALVMLEQSYLIKFFGNIFNNLEYGPINDNLKDVWGLQIWNCLSETRRNSILAEIPKGVKFWKCILKKQDGLNKPAKETFSFKYLFLFNHLKRFLGILKSFTFKDNEKEIDENVLNYICNFLSWMIDLCSQLITRRFFIILLEEMKFLIVCKYSTLYFGHCTSKVNLFTQLLHTLESFYHFEMSSLSGEPLDKKSLVEMHYKKVYKFQKCAFKYLEKLKVLSVSPVTCIDKEPVLKNIFENLKQEELKYLCDKMDENINFYCLEILENVNMTKRFYIDVLVQALKCRVYMIDEINEIPLYPTELEIWDNNTVPEDYNFKNCLALPKLNLRYLTVTDYLLRNFTLFRLESIYQIRNDIQDAAFRLKPIISTKESKCLFSGWCRMAQPISFFNIFDIAPSKLGTKCPARVLADVTVTFSDTLNIKEEWESLRRHDVVFLLTFDCDKDAKYSYSKSVAFEKQFKFKSIRGAEVDCMLDDKGEPIENDYNMKSSPTGSARTFRLFLDTNQYQLDVDDGNVQLYSTFNVILKRDPKQNNFKAVLETIRALINDGNFVPDWLLDVILGYGDPAAASYQNLPQKDQFINFNDTFLDYKHLNECLGQVELNQKEEGFNYAKLKFEKNGKTIVECGKRCDNVEKLTGVKVRRNDVPFTKNQVDAIKSGNFIYKK